MQLRLFLILASCALTACGGEANAPQEQQAEAPANNEEVPVTGPERRILAFGDSLFAGYNVKPAESFPAVLENRLRARGLDARVTNAGVSGDTTAAGLRRLAFTLDQQEQVPDLVIVELGGNDLLRGIDPAETRANLEAMLQELQRREIPVLLMGMRAPPNWGIAYQRAFDSLYPQLAEQYGAELVPFFLQSIYTRPDLIQPDRVHPTAEGIAQLVAATVDEIAEALPEPEAG